MFTGDDKAKVHEQNWVYIVIETSIVEIYYNSYNIITFRCAAVWAEKRRYRCLFWLLQEPSRRKNQWERIINNTCRRRFRSYQTVGSRARRRIRKQHVDVCGRAEKISERDGSEKFTLICRLTFCRPRRVNTDAARSLWIIKYVI